eukprot:scaffold248607_cov31-Tisochrysis_lutea.AAC.6
MRRAYTHISAGKCKTRRRAQANATAPARKTSSRRAGASWSELDAGAAVLTFGKLGQSIDHSRTPDEYFTKHGRQNVTRLTAVPSVQRR